MHKRSSRGAKKDYTLAAFFLAGLLARTAHRLSNVGRTLCSTTRSRDADEFDNRSRASIAETGLGEAEDSRCSRPADQ